MRKWEKNRNKDIGEEEMESKREAPKKRQYSLLEIISTENENRKIITTRTQDPG